MAAADTKWFPQDRLTHGAGPSFPCPSCGGPTGVRDSRPLGAGLVGIRRRRGCQKCGARFTTRERIFVSADEPDLRREGVFEALAALQARLLAYLPSDD